MDYTNSKVENIPKIVSNNPYRILGVYANSSKKDILSNKGKATAFLKVNKSVEYPLDLKGILPPINRTIEIFNEAEGSLSLPMEQIKYAQFWFIKKTSLDDIAFNHLLSGNMQMALDIWYKQENISSLQNRIICHLIEDNIELALQESEVLYVKYGFDYISLLDSNSTLQKTNLELLYLFLDSMISEVGLRNLLELNLYSETKSYLVSKYVDFLIKTIYAEVEKANKVDHKNAEARLKAARVLVKNTRKEINDLKTLLSGKDSQYQIIADKLGLEILQCGIDYFNHSFDEDRHQVAMKMQKYALSTVIGTIAIQRCQSNVDILQGLIDDLPLKEVKNEVDHIYNMVKWIRNAQPNVDNVLTFLQNTSKDLLKIKEILGKTNKYYVKQATLVAQVALSESIEAFNKLQENEVRKLDGPYRNTAIKVLCHGMAATWKAILWIQLIDADPSFKNEQLAKNKIALKKNLDEVEAFGKQQKYIGNALDSYLRSSRSVFYGCASEVEKELDYTIYYTEAELYEKCYTIDACQKYISRYPNGANIQNVKENLSVLLDDECFNLSITIDNLNNYLAKYPNGRHVSQAKEKIEILKEELRLKREHEIDSLIKQINSCNTINDLFPLKATCLKYEAESESLLSKFDDKFFSLCKGSSGLSMYMRQMGNFAKHRDEAKKKIQNEQRNIFIAAIVGILVVFGIILFTIIKQKQEKEEQELAYTRSLNAAYDKLRSTEDPDLCIQFLSDYPNSDDSKRQYAERVLNEQLKIKADSLINNNNGDISPLQEFVDNYSKASKFGNYEILTTVKNKISDINVAKIEQEAKEKAEAKRREDYEKYGTDANAWKTATALNTIAAYQEYLKRYPNGKNKSSANKRIIDLEVQGVINSGDYGSLPSSQKTSYGTGKSSTVRITNRCDREITIMYSGVESKKIVLSPYQTRSFVLPSSTYKVVATASGVRPFLGTENLTGGTYESEYYIQTIRTR